MFEAVIPGNRVEETSQDNMRNERERQGGSQSAFKKPNEP